MSNQPSATSALRHLSSRLDSRLEAELLLCHVLAVERSWLYAHGETELSPAQLEALSVMAERRGHGEPMAYILGEREFYGRSFAVSPAVLIPRPETELLVETVLEKLPRAEARVVDVGTGSGCIALSLAAERPQWAVTAIDVSAEALGVCRDNAERLGLAQVKLVRGDLLEPVQGQRFDAIVSNPPYIAEGDAHLAQGDLRFEPALALSTGGHGLDLIRKLIAQAPDCLESGGYLLMEHGYDQAALVRGLLVEAGFTAVETRTDLVGIERVSLGQR